jgi:hypothetical protein
MPNKEINTPYPLIDADPHFGRVVRYMRPTDLGLWAAMTAAVPGVLHAWGMHGYSEMGKQVVNT